MKLYPEHVYRPRQYVVPIKDHVTFAVASHFVWQGRRQSALAFACFIVVQLSSAERTVIIMRHCARATPSSAYGAPGFNNFDNYSDAVFLPFPVPAYQCLHRGLQYITSNGQQLQHILPAGPVTLTVDSAAQRDLDTASALLAGLGATNTSNYQHAPALFDPESAGVCTKMPTDAIVAALKARLVEFPPPSSHHELLDSLQKTLGQGAAPALSTIKDTIGDSGYFTGGSSVASAFAEAFLMQQGGGLPVAWDRLTTAEVEEYLQLHIFYRGVQDRALPVVARSHSNMVHHILDYLKQLDHNGTWVLVGHDGDLDALATLFGLSWHTRPYPPNATTPGSALRLDVPSDGSTITGSMLYNTFEQAPEHTGLQQVPVAFTWGGGGDTMPFTAFAQRAREHNVTECVQNK